MSSSAIHKAFSIVFIIFRPSLHLRFSVTGEQTHYSCSISSFPIIGISDFGKSIGVPLRFSKAQGVATKKTQHTKDYKALIRELKAARIAADYTQKEVATALGRHPPFISKIESGERRIDVIELITLCGLYDVKMMQLLRKAGLD
ncbi:MAG: helix-turn-helix transcriptional regulator [Bdellovibrionaceae bacterium]|nr:helix-turn-helix transcriptional regulator [Pseudobdellovibrionaceae bacterium]